MISIEDEGMISIEDEGEGISRKLSNEGGVDWISGSVETEADRLGRVSISIELEDKRLIDFLLPFDRGIVRTTIYNSNLLKDVYLRI